ncbi:MAG: NADH-quinone oxidoreductase subunit H [Lachnospiraceae bacterium]|nr:NADH-quinone oxidoreductase subunit H [Lachnospiraceae bacterium]
MNSTVIMILNIAAFLILAPVVGFFLEGYDRVLSSRLQRRMGPPFLQPVYDLIKLFEKQAIVVNNFETALVLGFTIFTIFSGCLFFAGGDILLVFFAFSLADMFLVLAASSANSPYSSLGSQREFVQMMAYEPMTLLTAIGFYMTCGSFNVSDIINQDMPAIVRTPGVFLGYCFILIIKLRKSPFDLSTSHHAHQEMVKGLTQDIAGNVLGILELGEIYEEIFLMAIVMLFFICKNPISYVVGAVVALIVFFIMIVIDNVFPRVKWNNMLITSWGVTLSLAGSNFLVLTMLKIARI